MKNDVLLTEGTMSGDEGQKPKGNALTDAAWISKIGEGGSSLATISLMDAVERNTALSDLPELLANYQSSIRIVDSDTLDKIRKLESDINERKREIDKLSKILREERLGSEGKERQIENLEKTLIGLRDQLSLNFILNRVNPDAQKMLMHSESFKKKFLSTSECKAFVVAVDIRRSTELMLKARRPEDFARFITTLCSDLKSIVIDSYGVFDKFTGDGVLAFFPEFYSGQDAGFYALQAAERFHSAFNKHYRSFRSAFSSVLMDTGLGIGIDYGDAQLVQVADGLTLVGVPVVYACRLSSATAGKTLLNQPAYDKISERFSGKCFIAETEQPIKNEGSILAYEVTLNKSESKPLAPEWLKEMEQIINPTTNLQPAESSK
jgi:class 3 adenylate cyclase